jgi:hypothetical protein
MALTVVQMQVLRSAYGEDYKVIKVTGDTSYPTGGYAITPALFNFNAFATDGYGTGLPPVAGNYEILGDGNGNTFAGINPANGNMQLYVTTTGVEVAGASTAATSIVFLGANGH